MSIARKSPLRQKTQERYRDSRGLAFDEVRAYVEIHFGMRPSEWPRIKEVKDPDVCSRMHDLFCECWNCGGEGGYGTFRRIEVHHICGGTKGRNDEPCNTAMLCNLPRCHPSANTSELPIGRVLFLKWKHDRQNCDWVRLTLLNRKFLPELIP